MKHRPVICRETSQSKHSSWRATFLEHVGPGGFSGVTFGDWVRVLCDNHGDIDLKYWPRASLITANSLLNSMARLWEDHRYGPAIAETVVPPPLFILGVWRSGTTHLHNLLASDDRFAFPNTYEVNFPHTFLTTETWGSRVMQWMMPAKRPMDNLPSGVGRPQEDELALVASRLSFLLGLLVFPRSGRPYQNYLTLGDASVDERDRWKAAWMRFLQKLTLKYGRPLVLKSPAHMARLEVLLDMFPTAKFVHIHRNPYAVFQSSVHMWRQVQPLWALQDSEINEERILEDYNQIYDSFFAQRHRLTEKNFCEVRFEELEHDPLGQLRRIYQSLGLPEFATVCDFHRSVGGYTKNTFPELPASTRLRVARAWSRSFEQWGYAK